jgi:hypothetical protein
MNRRNVLGGVIGAFCGLLTWIPAVREKLGRSFGDVKISVPTTDGFVAEILRPGTKAIPKGSMIQVEKGNRLFYGYVTRESVGWQGVQVITDRPVTIESSNEDGTLTLRIKHQKPAK